MTTTYMQTMLSVPKHPYGEFVTVKAWTSEAHPFIAITEGLTRDQSLTLTHIPTGKAIYQSGEYKREVISALALDIKDMVDWSKSEKDIEKELKAVKDEICNKPTSPFDNLTAYLNELYMDRREETVKGAGNGSN